MERVIKFFAWDAMRWESRAASVKVGLNVEVNNALPRVQQWHMRERRKVARGKLAYAYRQAALRWSLHAKACKAFEALIPRLEEMPDIVEYTPPKP